MVIQEHHLRLSEDKKQVTDKDGNVVYAQKEQNGEKYYIDAQKVEALDSSGKMCVKWEEHEWCVKWDENEVCLKVEKGEVCIEKK